MRKLPLLFSPHLAEFAKLRLGWCEHAVRLIVNERGGFPEPAASARERADDDTLERSRRRFEAMCVHEFAVKRVRPPLAESIVQECWASVVSHSRQDEVFGGDIPRDDLSYKRWLTRKGVRDHSTDQERLHDLWVQHQLGHALGTDPIQIGRWEAVTSLPPGEKVLEAVLIALRSELNKFPFPSRYSILSGAAARTLACIRQRGDYGGSSPAGTVSPPTTLVIAALRAAFRDEWADALVPDVGAEMEERIDEVLVRVSETLSRRKLTAEVVDPDRIHDIVLEWGESYALFRVGLASGWQNATEMDWTWAHLEDPDRWTRAPSTEKL